MTKYLLTFFIFFFLTSCDSPEKYSKEWFQKEFKDPNSKASQMLNLLEESSRKVALEKYDLWGLLSDDDFNSQDSETKYLYTLKLCSANFMVMNGIYNIKIKEGTSENIYQNEVDDYIDLAQYFFTRASEIESNIYKVDYDVKAAEIDLELLDMIDEMWFLDEDLEVLEENKALCIFTKEKNPNHKNYNFD